MGTRWGQNFLMSEKYAARIAEQARGHSRVFEIGPGRGILTHKLLEMCDTLVAVEIDRQLCDRLSAAVSDVRFSLHNRDVLDFDFGTLGSDPYFAIGNIPYQITSPLLQRLLSEWSRWSGMALLVQEEVARRICAAPGERDYSALSVMAASFAQCEVALRIHHSHFQPRPQVDSALVRFRFHDHPLTDDPAGYARFLKTVFSQRRKKLLNGLSQLFNGERPGEAYAWIGLDRRIETVEVADVARLYQQYGADKRKAEG